MQSLNPTTTRMLRLAKVFYSPTEYESAPAEFWHGQTAVVIDVLRATSTVVTALAEGVGQVVCFKEVAEARTYAKGRLKTALAGERGGRAPEGFRFGNSPREFVGIGGEVETLALTTTNGTRALQAAAAAERVIVCSLLNLGAVAASLRKAKDGAGDLVVVCSGTGECFSLEDALVAGALLAELGIQHPMTVLYRSCETMLREAFYESSNGRNLRRLGLEVDIDWCLQRDRYPILPIAQPDGTVRL